MQNQRGFLQKLFERVIGLDHDKNDSQQELLKSMIIESIETTLELEDARIAQIDDARKVDLLDDLELDCRDPTLET